jgi:hypothetical protein
LLNGNNISHVYNTYLYTHMYVYIRTYVYIEYNILSVVQYGCETLSLILKVEHRLRIFENRVLRKIFASKRNEAIAGWRKLHNEELHNLC